MDSPQYPSFAFPELPDPKKTTFKITIADSYVGYLYPFEIREDMSIADIARGIAERFETEVPKGKIVWESNHTP